MGLPPKAEQVGLTVPNEALKSGRAAFCLSRRLYQSEPQPVNERAQLEGTGRVKQKVRRYERCSFGDSTDRD